MSETINELLNFLKSNAISIVALIISFFAFVMSFKSFRHGSRADVKIAVEGDWNFDYVVEKSAYEDGYVIKNRGKVGEVSVKNKGGVRTMLEALYVNKKVFRERKRVTIAPLEDGWDFIGVERRGRDISWLSFSDVIIEPGDRIPLKKSDRRIFEHLFKKGLFELSKQDQGQFQLIIKHTFAEEESNPFRIILSSSTLKFLQLGCNERAFIDEYKSARA